MYEDFHNFIKGADLSFLDEFEQKFIYKEKGVETSPLQSLKNHGIAYIRLRVWNDPQNGWNNKQRTLYMAKRVHEHGFKLLIDFHYSDTWAGPHHQKKPIAWMNHDISQLRDDVYAYTTDVLKALKEQGTPAQLVQIGNEIGGGLLREEGNTSNWEGFVGLLKEGCRAAKNTTPDVKIIIHNEYGGRKETCDSYYRRLIADGVDFDIIGLSYYRNFEGPIKQFKDNIYNLADKYDKHIMVVETSYPWTLENFDDRKNYYQSTDQLEEGYDASLEGQFTYLRDLMDVIAKAPNHRGVGLFYWPTEYVTLPDRPSSSSNQSFWDSRTGELLPSIKVWSLPVKIGSGV